MNCIFIYNPNSGSGKIVKHLDYIKKILETKFDEVTLYATKSGEDARNKASESCGKFDVLVFSGGDGTVNDIITGISRNDKRPILGYSPAGTVNDISKNLRISKNPRKALKNIIDGDIINHDVGMINDKYFMYVSAIGTFTGVSYRTEQHLKRKYGKIAYAVDGLKDIVSPKMVDIKISANGHNYNLKVPLLLVMNTKSVGGILFNKYGHLNDGYFDIVIVKNGINRGLANIARLMIFGIRKKSLHKHFIFIKASDFVVTVNDDITWCIDGEAGPKGQVHIKNLHHHVQFFVPKIK